MRHLSGWRICTIAAFLGAASVWLAGCGGEGEKRISATSGKYEVGDDKEPAANTPDRNPAESRRLPAPPANLQNSSDDPSGGPASGGALSNRTDRKTVGNSDNKTKSGSSGERPSSRAADETGTAAGATKANPKTTPKTTPKSVPKETAGGRADAAASGTAANPNSRRIPVDQISPRNIPDGTPEELLGVLEDLRNIRPKGRTREEQMEELRNKVASRMILAERVFKMDDATDDDRFEAASHIIDVVLQATKLGMEGTDDRLLELCMELARDKSPKLVRLGRLTQFQVMLSGVVEGNKDAIRQMMAELAGILAMDNPDEEVFQTAMNAVAALKEGNQIPEFASALTQVGTTFKDHANPEIVRRSEACLDMAAAIEQKLDETLDGVASGTDKNSDKLLQLANNLMAARPTEGMLGLINQTIVVLENVEKYADAGAMLDIIEKSYADVESEKIRERAAEIVAHGRRRSELIGKPLDIQGTLVDGSTLDWSEYQGKVVLVYFWTASSNQSVLDLMNVRNYYLRTKKDGFEVISVNIDKEQLFKQFFGVNTLPFATLVAEAGMPTGFQMKQVVECGVSQIPSGILLAKDGTVAALNAVGQRIPEKVTALLKDEISTPPADGEVPASSQKNSGLSRSRSSSFVAMSAPAERQIGEQIEPPAEPQTESRAEPKVGVADRTSSRQLESEQQGTGDAKAAAETLENPYAARADLTSAELLEFLLAMQEKPRSIQARPGFVEAVVDASDRLLAGNPTDKMRAVAACFKMTMLHKKACSGDVQADAQLIDFARKINENAPPRIASDVRFYEFERKAIDGEQIELEMVPALLEELQTYVSSESLEARHLRLASSIVTVINRLENVEQREKLFVKFGMLFAKSSDKELARYGKKLAKPAGAAQSELVGQTLELSGVTSSGEEFQWSKYRGKVVIVDFWATWCGPCVRELPSVKLLYERLHDKGLEIVGVSLDKDLEALDTFLAANSLPWETLAGESTQDLATRYSVRAIPTMLLVDREGKIINMSHQSSSLVAILEKILEN